MRLLVVGFVGDYLTKYFRNINVEVVTCARRNADYCVDYSHKIDYKEYFGEDCFDVVVDCMNSYSTNMLQSIDGNVKTTENFFQFLQLILRLQLLVDTYINLNRNQGMSKI